MPVSSRGAILRNYFGRNGKGLEGPTIVLLGCGGILVRMRKSAMTKNKKTLSQAIQERRATPSFDGAPIPAEDLKQILEAGLNAPSGYNIQPWRFVVVQS